MRAAVIEVTEPSGLQKVLVRVETANGVTYEINDQEEWRQVHGIGDPTPVDGKAGQWRHFHTISPCVVSIPMMVTWEVDEQKNGELEVLATITAPVTKIAPTDEGLRKGTATLNGQPVKAPAAGMPN